MEFSEIKELAEKYREALAKELVYKHDAQRRYALILACVADDENTGAALANDLGYQAAIDHAGHAKNERRVLAAEIGLAKAWLYSQAGKF